MRRRTRRKVEAELKVEKKMKEEENCQSKMTQVALSN